jgi:hypothetical protein
MTGATKKCPCLRARNLLESRDDCFTAYQSLNSTIPWISSISQLRPTKIIGTATTFAAVANTIYQAYNMTTPVFRPVPVTSPTPHPTTSSPDAIQPHEQHQSTRDSKLADSNSYGKPELANDTAHSPKAYPPPHYVSSTSDLSQTGNEEEELQAFKENDRSSQSRS